MLEGLEGISVSVDTSKAEVARRALDLGVEMVNDVTALRGDPDMAAVVAEHGVYVCLMHMLGEPRTMQRSPQYDDVVAEVFAFLEERIAFAIDCGIAEERICVDPGIGFGKTPDQNLELVRRLDVLAALGRPIVVGLSRKSTLGKVLGDPSATQGTAAASVGGAVAAFERGAWMLRAHDVRRHGRGTRGCGRGRTGKGESMTIELKSLVLFGHHGYLEEERRLGQRFLVDLWVDVDDDAASSDDLDETVDYRYLASLVREVFAGPERLLLEGLAGAVVDGHPGALRSSRTRARARSQAGRRAGPAGRACRGHRRAEPSRRAGSGFSLTPRPPMTRRTSAWGRISAHAR